MMPSLLLVFALTFMQCGNYKMLVGTYTQDTESEGIYALEFDKKELCFLKLLATSENPSF